MNKTGGFIKDTFNKGKEITSDTSKPIKSAIKELNAQINSEFETAKNLNEARQKRKESVANRLSTLRNDAGEKQKNVAEKIGINVITLSGYEVGKSEPNFEVLVRLADFYKVSLDFLLCRTNTKIEFDKEAYRARDEERKQMQNRLEELEEALSEIKRDMK